MPLGSCSHSGLIYQPVRSALDQILVTDEYSHASFQYRICSSGPLYEPVRCSVYSNRFEEQEQEVFVSGAYSSIEVWVYPMSCTFASQLVAFSPSACWRQLRFTTSCCNFLLHCSASAGVSAVMASVDFSFIANLVASQIAFATLYRCHWLALNAEKSLRSCTWKPHGNIWKQMIWTTCRCWTNGELLDLAG